MEAHHALRAGSFFACGSCRDLLPTTLCANASTLLPIALRIERGRLGRSLAYTSGGGAGAPYPTSHRSALLLQLDHLALTLFFGHVASAISEHR
jgi:hypothetical protein